MARTSVITATICIILLLGHSSFGECFIDQILRELARQRAQHILQLYPDIIKDLNINLNNGLAPQQPPMGGYQQNQQQPIGNQPNQQQPMGYQQNQQQPQQQSNFITAAKQPASLNQIGVNQQQQQSSQSGSGGQMNNGLVDSGQGTPDGGSIKSANNDKNTGDELTKVGGDGQAKASEASKSDQ